MDFSISGSGLGDYRRTTQSRLGGCDDRVVTRTKCGCHPEEGLRIVEEVHFERLLLAAFHLVKDRHSASTIWMPSTRVLKYQFAMNVVAVGQGEGDEPRE
jgi:hypothetical protein